MSIPGFDSPLWLVLLPLAGALLLVVVGRLNGALRNGLTVLALLGNLALALRWHVPATPALATPGGLEVSGQRWGFTLQVDALGGLLLLLVAVGSVLAAAYAATEPGTRPRGVYSAAAFLLAVGMANGALVAGDLVTLYGFAELASLAIMLLLLAEASPAAQRAGFKLFASVEVTGLAVLLAILLLAGKGTSLEFGSLAPFAGLGLVAQGVLLALVVRTGLAPLHTWLAETLETASWSNAVLAGSVAAPLGAYLLLRLGGSLALPGLALRDVLLVLGAATVLIAMYTALRQRSIRQTGAALVIAQGGFLALGLAGAGRLAVEAALAQVASMVLTTALLFVAMGTLLGSTEPAEPFALQKAVARRPLAGLALAVALLSAAGLPPFYGFYARQYALQSVLDNGGTAALLGITAALLATGGLLIAAMRLIALTLGSGEMASARAWWQGRRAEGLPLAAAMLVLVVLALLPRAAQRWLVAPAATALWPQADAAGVPFWSSAASGILLLVALAGGAWLFTENRRSLLPTLPGAIVTAFGRVSAGVEKLSVTGRLDPYNLVAGIVTAVGRAVAVAIGAVLDRLAI